MMYDRAELTQFKPGSNCCKSRFWKVKSFKLACIGSVWLVYQRGQRLIAFPAVSRVDCCMLQMNCVSQRLYCNLHLSLLCLSVSALQTVVEWEDITTGIAMVS